MRKIFHIVFEVLRAITIKLITKWNKIILKKNHKIEEEQGKNGNENFQLIHTFFGTKIL